MIYSRRTIAQITLGEMRQITISQAGKRGPFTAASLVIILTIPIADSRVKAVLDWLSPLNMYQKQQDTLSRRHGITSSWLLVDPIFKAWIDSESSQQSLWCPGNRKHSTYFRYLLTHSLHSGNWQDCHHVCIDPRQHHLFGNADRVTGLL